MNFLQEGKYDQAIQEFTQVLELKQNLIYAHIHIGMDYDMMGKPEFAFPNFDKALQIDPNSSDALREKGYTLMNRGSYD